jgi:hypothetical protein
MADRRVKDQDVEEGSPDRLGDTMEAADSAPAEAVPQPASAPAKPTPDVTARVVVPTSLRQRVPVVTAVPEQKQSVMPEANPEAMPPPAPLPSTGTVVLDVEQGGIVVPSFLGKSVRSAIEMAQESGLDLDAVGSGLARQQSPPPGSHVASGAQVTVKFGR